MPRLTLNWSREKVQQQLAKDIAGLQVEFANHAWAHELLPLLKETHEIAGEAQADTAKLADLRHRVELVLRKHELKAFEGYLWMIDDCLRK
jgi:hypothetical protein